MSFRGAGVYMSVGSSSAAPGRRFRASSLKEEKQSAAAAAVAGTTRVAVVAAAMASEEDEIRHGAGAGGEEHAQWTVPQSVVDEGGDGSSRSDLATAYRRKAFARKRGPKREDHNGGEQQQERVEDVDDDDTAVWVHTLVAFGGLPQAAARRIATILSQARMPPPSPLIAPFVTHEMLKEVGVHRPSERARVIVALKTCPRVDEAMLHPSPPADVVAVALEQADDVKKQLSFVGNKSGAAGGGSPTGKSHPRGFLSEDGDVHVFDVRLLHHDAAVVVVPSANNTTDVASSSSVRNSPRQVHWRDVVGKRETNPAAFDDQVRGAEQLFNDRTSVMLRHVPSSMHVSDRRRPIRGGDDAGVNGIETMEVKLHQDDDHRARRNQPKTLAFDVFGAPRPFPAFIVDGANPALAAIVLRVPTPDVAHEAMPTISNLTNKWIVVADGRSNTLATFRRLDSAALCRLRVSAEGSTLSHRQLLTAVFTAFIKDFAAVIEDVTDTLDECEVALFDRTKSNWVIDTLIHVQRRAGVYQRLVELNQKVVRRAGVHFSCRDTDDLDALWAKLKESTSNLLTRSERLLNMVLGLSGQRTTEVMTVLTKVSFCVQPLSFITGVYGMNFLTFPELRYEYAYYIVLGGMLLIVVCAWMWLKHLGL